MYAEHEALIDIRTLEVIGGSLPRRALALTIEWAIEHRKELMRTGSYANPDNTRNGSNSWSNPRRTLADPTSGDRHYHRRA
ncbi:MAG: DUF4160 domain-containing protein [Methyloversatilis sp.]|nr:DUF4160 domain-containing protein [Methyloversatilis sp.]